MHRSAASVGDDTVAVEAYRSGCNADADARYFVQLSGSGVSDVLFGAGVIMRYERVDVGR